jgi:hypothetical protein
MNTLDQIMAGENIDALRQEFQASSNNENKARHAVAQAEQLCQAYGPQAFAFDAEGFASLSVGERTYAAGRFSTPTLGELKARLGRAAQPAQARLSVLIGNGRDDINNIEALQGWGDSRTLYQLASQFNCLESPGTYLTDVTNYFGDRTQGPYSAVSAFPGALLRHYAAPGPDGQHFSQRAEHEINLLADAFSAEQAVVQAGYLKPRNIKVSPAALGEQLAAHFDQIRIGLHEEVEVCFGAHWQPVPAGQVKITQAMTSTLDISSIFSQTEYLPIIRHLLRAAYLGTLLGAAVTGKQRVLLTAIGGGVFENPHPEIWDAITWAVTEARPWLAQDLDVILNVRKFDSIEGRKAADFFAQEAPKYGGRLITF